MPNKNYQRGRRKEYKICDDLRKEGFEIVQRSAGSHSPVDIFAIHKEKQIILFIQSKPFNYRISDKNLINKKNYWLNNLFRGYFEVR